MPVRRQLVPCFPCRAVPACARPFAATRLAGKPTTRDPETVRPPTLSQLQALAFRRGSPLSSRGEELLTEFSRALSLSLSFASPCLRSAPSRLRLVIMSRSLSLADTVDMSARVLTALTPPSSGAGRKALSVGAIVAICLGAFALSKIVLGTLCYLRWKKMHTECEMKLSGGKMIIFQVSGKATPSSKAVLRKTETLKKQDVIGSGGYGTVYKLELDEHTRFAVKKLARGGQDQERGFERELETLADIKHRNLCALRGYYSAPEINVLIYDLMDNGNLDTWLHDRVKKGGKPLDWDLRLSIAIGSARGICYLHHDCIPHIIHRDIKTSNILLDADMEAHVSDFGLAKLISSHQTHVTTMVAGTLGYLPPEYLETGKITEKGDVYSFGVVLLEILTGKRPTDSFFMEGEFSVVQWAKALVEDDHPEDIFDEYILGACPDEDLLSTLEIAFQCLVQQPQARPTMQLVVKMLEGLRPDLGGAEHSSLGFNSSRLAHSSHSGMSSRLTSSSDSSAMMSAASSGPVSAASIASTEPVSARSTEFLSSPPTSAPPTL